MTPGSASPLLLDAAGGYQIPRSLRFRASASAYLTRSVSSAGDRKKWTLSFWVKRGKLGNYNILFNNNDYNGTYIAFGGAVADTLLIGDYSSSYNYQLVTTQVFRDTSAWYHIVIAFDTSQATAANRVKVYCNGTQITSFGTATYPTQNYDAYWNQANTHYIGRSQGGYDPFDGYMTEINFINGQQLDHSSFGQTDITTGVWTPKKYTGSYGTNGFYLNFSDNSAVTAAAIGKDYSGNGNNWTPNNISLTAGSTYDSMIDTPTPYDDGGNGRGNYATLSPVFAGAGTTLSNANLTATLNVANAFGSVSNTTGKWYFEVTCSNTPTGTYIGLMDSTFVVVNSSGWSTQARAYVSTGSKYDGTTTAYGASYTLNDIIGVAYDLDAGSIVFYKNNVSQGTAFTSLSGKEWKPFAYAGSTTGIFDFNFGQRPFSYTPPSGYKALNTQNLSTPTIVKPNAWFDVKLDTGANIKTTAEATFSGDELIWIKDRANANNHQLIDTVRGATNVLQSNTTSVDTTYSTPTGNSVGWVWKEGATPGFDIVTYTGTGVNRTVSHSLGVAPAMMIVKNRSSAQNWVVYHKSNGATPQNNILRLNTTDASLASSGSWNNTAPTSSLFTVGTLPAVNGSGNDMVAYLFSEVSDYSAFGSYTGNGSADGPFVYCGFRPAFVLIKASSSGTLNWNILDAKRIEYNVDNNPLSANLSDAEGTSDFIDITSNGFKIRNSAATVNNNTTTFIFAAFAENPFKYALAR